jgi:hypothetical protein
MKPRTFARYGTAAALLAVAGGMGTVINKAVNSRGSIFLNIDRDDNSLDEVLEVTTNGTLPLMTVLENGRVGIGTADPEGTLELRAPTAILTLANDQDPLSRTRIRDNATNHFTLNKYNSAGGVLMDVNPAPLNGIDGAGIRIFRSTNTTGARYVHFHRGDGSNTVDNEIGVGGRNSYFQMGGGRFGIGTSSPDVMLDVAGDGQFTGGDVTLWDGNRALTMRIDGAGDSFVTNKGNFNGNGADPGGLLVLTGSAGMLLRYGESGGSGSTGIALTSSGDVGIATGSPGFRLHVNGDAGKPGGGSWSVASDRRLKKNVEDLDGALDTMLELRGVEFEYIDPESINELPGQRIGFIGQEVEAVFPDWVSDGPDGYKRLAVRGFPAVAVEAIRELRAEKDAQIAALKSEVESLRALVDRLVEADQVHGLGER